jgi:TonB family protein
LRTGWSQRRVTIDLPLNADRSTAEQAVWAVFYKPTESVLPGCTPEDKEFRKALVVHTLTVRDGTKIPYPPTGLCLPFGERIRNHVGENALAPKPLSTPDPAIPQDAPRELDALVILGVVVDSSGHPQTIMVLKSQSYSFDISAAKAVSSWKFNPATFQDQPVPVFINVEVHYHRH